MATRIKKIFLLILSACPIASIAFAAEKALSVGTQQETESDLGASWSGGHTS